MRSRFVAAITRDSTRIDVVPPTRRISPTSSTRSSFACRSTDISPISSRKMLPPLAYSNRPSFSRVAFVNAPCMCPKSSPSIIESGSALALTGTKRPRRDESLWTPWATSSLPVPDSPRMSTGSSLAATRATS